MTQKLPDVLYYPKEWEEEYRQRRTVSAWGRRHGESRGKRKPGTLQYFAQYAVMHLLRRDYNLASLTWLHIAQVDNKTRKGMIDAETTDKSVPSQSKQKARTLKQWTQMRKYMGWRFDSLQERLVQAGFSRHTGEPDLFCYSTEGRWLFVEVKTKNEPLGEHQKKWFKIAETIPGGKLRIKVITVLPKPST